VFDGKREIPSEGQSVISVTNRRSFGVEEKVEERRRWFKFLSSGKSPSVWGIAASTANSHALTGP